MTERSRTYPQDLAYCAAPPPRDAEEALARYFDVDYDTLKLMLMAEIAKGYRRAARRRARKAT